MQNTKRRLAILQVLTILALLPNLTWSLDQMSYLPQSKVHTSKVYGNLSLGYYYANLYVGTPPQRVSMILDTGSGIQAFPCSGCTRCGANHINGLFKKQASSSYRQVKCDEKDTCKMCRSCSSFESERKSECSFSIFYSEGSSLRGSVGEDRIVLDSLVDQYFEARQGKLPMLRNDTVENLLQAEGVKAKFGCIKQETHLFLNQEADGIFGLNPKRDSNLLEKIHEQHSKYTGQGLSFSLCFTHNGGWFTVGGDSPIPKKSAPVKLSYRDSGGMYSLNLRGVKVGDVDLGFSDYDFMSGGGMFVDSGATYTYFASPKYKVLETQLDKVCLSFDCVQGKGEQNKCFAFNDHNFTLAENMARFPTISFLTPSGQSIYWKPDLYFVIRNVQLQEVCLSILPYSRNILGQTWMSYRDIKFDLERYNVQISDSDCGNNTPNTTSHMYDIQKGPLAQKPVQLPQGEEMIWIFVIIIVVVSVFGAAVVIVYACTEEQIDKGQRKRAQRERVESQALPSEVSNISEQKQPGSPVLTVISDRIIPESRENDQNQAQTSQ